MTAPAAIGYRLIEKPSRVVAVDLNDVEICGARQPYGHEIWTIYVTARLNTSMHQVLAMTRETAVAHVQMIAELFVAAHRG
jgi:hypothetical protein